MHRVAAVLQRDGDQTRDVQVGARAGGTQDRSIVGRAQVRRVHVVVGIDGGNGRPILEIESAGIADCQSKNASTSKTLINLKADRNSITILRSIRTLRYRE
jgi:hypothetical protein